MPAAQTSGHGFLGHKVYTVIGLAAVVLFGVGQLALIRVAIQSQSCDDKLVGGDFISSDELETHVESALRARWDYWPFEGRRPPSASADEVVPRIGIVTGGSSDLFGGGPGSYGDATSCLLRLLAEHRGYAFYAERALQRLGTDRPVAWQKIRLLLDRLSDVDLIIWIDADIAWTEANVDLADLFFQRLSTRSACSGHLGQPRWDGIAGMAAGADTEEGIFMWASADVRPRQEKNMNLNSAVMALRSNARARGFLESVWAEGNDPESFKKYNPGWRKQPPGHHYWGWPFEQGAVWSVLDGDHELLRRTCIVSVGTLHSVQYHRWTKGGSPGAHMPGMLAEDRRKAACHHLATDLMAPGQCGKALRRCPDLFAGRLIAAHADDLCRHCLGPEAVRAPRELPTLDAAAAVEWNNFDCACLRPL